MPEVQHAAHLRAGVAAAIDHIRAVLHERLDELYELLRIVFEVGVLDGDQIAAGRGDPAP
jgi:hypothetical protein